MYKTAERRSGSGGFDFLHKNLRNVKARNPYRHILRKRDNAPLRRPNRLCFNGYGILAKAFLWIWQTSLTSDPVGAEVKNGATQLPTQSGRKLKKADNPTSDPIGAEVTREVEK